MNETADRCSWCGWVGDLIAGERVRPINPQVDLPHLVRHCPECKQAMLDVAWPDKVVRRKAREHTRRFRKPLWVVVYPVVCAWCGSTNTEPYEVNATIANPVSTRFKYDIYRCNYCQRPSAISYLGEIRTHRADQDRQYTALWYLDPPEAE